MRPKKVMLLGLLLLVQCDDQSVNSNNEAINGNDSNNKTTQSPLYLSEEWINVKTDSLLSVYSECENIYLGQDANGLSISHAGQLDVVYKGSIENELKATINKLKESEDIINAVEILASPFDSSVFVVALRSFDYNPIQDSLGKLKELGYTHLIFVDSLKNCAYSIIDIRGFPYTGDYNKPTLYAGYYNWSIPHAAEDSLRIFLDVFDFANLVNYKRQDTLIATLYKSLDSSAVKQVVDSHENSDGLKEYWFYQAAKFDVQIATDHVIGYYAGYSEFRWHCKTYGSKLLYDMSKNLGTERIPVINDSMVVLNGIDSNGLINMSTYDSNNY